MSAAFKNAKRKLNQHELRRLMNEQKGLVKQKTQKIQSPLAKYTETGQLTCVLCKTIVRSEAVWNVHINTKQHKENIALAKKLKDSISDKTSLKRPKSPTTDSSSEKSKKFKPQVNEPSEQKAIPPDFFDSTNGKDSTNQTETSAESGAPAEILPEGFFDDPKKDARARNLEYRDPVEEEWEKFQKEMKELNNVSAAMIAEDQEEATTERQIDEIDEQIRNWSRVLDLERKKETIKKAAREQEYNQTDEHMSDDETFDEFLDWRSKNSF